MKKCQLIRNVQSRSIVLFFCSFLQVSAQSEVTDYRFFIRSIVRHSDFITKVTLITTMSFGHLFMPSLGGLWELWA